MRSDVACEFRILKTICDGKEAIRGQLIPALKTEHFSTSVTQNVWRRIMRLHTTHGEIPNWRDLRIDPGVREDTRKAMREFKKRPFENKADITSAMGTLDRLRQVRLLFEAGAELERQLEEDEVDPESVVQKLQSSLGKISKSATETIVTRVGKGGNAVKVAKKILTRTKSRFISTGLKVFDIKNAGFPDSGVVLLAANTGGGKSTMLDNIIEAIAMRGAKVAKFPLEMDGEESISRDMSRITFASMTDLIEPSKRIKRDELKKIYLKYKRFNEAMAKRGGILDIIEPGFMATLESMLAYCDPFNYDVIAIDYVGLMEGVNGDDQWRALSNALAYAKRWASRPGKKTLIIFAAQIAGDDTLRQSKAMGDHCTNIWRWRVGKDERESNFVEVFQDKCRFGDTFSFPVYVDFEHMLFRDLTPKEYEEWQLASRDKMEGKKGKGNSWKSGGKKRKKRDDEDLPEDDDDEVANDNLPQKKVKRRVNSY